MNPNPYPLNARACFRQTGKLWFLWCSSLRLASGEWTARPVLPINLDPNFQLKRRSRYLVPPRQKDLDKSGKAEDDPIPEMMHNLRSDFFLCCYTGKLKPVSERVEVSYKFVILDHEANADSEEAKRLIPAALRHAEPTLDQVRCRRNSPGPSLLREIP